jgi:hypothetical protein
MTNFKFTFPAATINEIATQTDNNDHYGAVITLAEELRAITENHWSSSISKLDQDIINDAKEAEALQIEAGWTTEESSKKRAHAFMMAKIHLTQFFNNADEVLAAF